MNESFNCIHTVSDVIKTTGDVIATCVVLVYVNTAQQTENCHVMTVRDHPTIHSRIKLTRQGNALKIKQWNSLREVIDTTNDTYLDTWICIPMLLD